MFKSLILSFVLVPMLLFTASPALAQSFGLEATRNKAQYGDANIYVMISSTISVVLSVAGLVFLAIMFYAGLRWMTARGNEEFISKAKDAMFGALIGFVLVSVSYGLSAFIFSRLIK